MNAPAVDLVAMKGRRNVRIAVKTSGPSGNSAQWTAKHGWKSLFKGKTRPDFAIFVWFCDRDRLDAYRVFVVPANIVDRDVLRTYKFWHSHKRRDGKPRKQGGHVAIRWVGKDTDGNKSSNFAHKWRRFENGWPLLEKHERTK